MKTLDYIALILVAIRAINWGLIGFFDFNLVRAIFGEMTVVSRIIYACGYRRFVFIKLPEG